MKEQIKASLITIDHVNIGVLALGGIALLIITVIFLRHSKAFLRNASDSLKDPATGKWSPKICTAFMASLVIFVAHLVWLKSAFITNNFSQLENILLIDYGYLTVAYGLRTAEKMQAKKIDGAPNEEVKKEVV